MKTMPLSPILAVLLAAAVHGAICDKTYYLQTGRLVMLAGPTTASVIPTSTTTVGKELAGVEIMHPETEYDVVTRFEGASACADWKKTNIDFTSRKKGANSFSAITTSSNLVKLHSTPYPFAIGIDFEYWFGFASSLKGDTAIIFEAIGKLRAGATQPHVWYGTATMTRNIKDAVLGTPKGVRTHYFQALTSHPDSAALQKALLDPWKDFKDNDTQTVSFKVQLIKATYDSIPPSTGIRGGASRSKSAGFQSSQSGNLVLIRPGGNTIAPAEALGLYNMMGHKIATLHPTGYHYQWNGRTSAGAEAATGVYFVQSGSRILGKFFYSR